MKSYQHLYSACRLCPHNCGVDRLSGMRGYCGETAQLTIACAGLHCGEEPPLAGKNGSGTIFFSGCTLQCPYCQNWQISSEGVGSSCSLDDFISICFDLQRRGAENINVVTGTHFVPTIVEGLRRAREEGLTLPVVWNSSGFEEIETLRLLDEHVDVYLPDCKTVDKEYAERLEVPPGYSESVVAALDFMTSAKPCTWENGVLKSGTVIRHLVLPGLFNNTRRTVKAFSERWKEKAMLSLLVQFQPIARKRSEKWHAENSIPFRKVSKKEYEKVVALLDEFGIDEGFIQERSSNTDWLPDFQGETMFPSLQFTLVWDGKRRTKEHI